MPKKHKCKYCKDTGICTKDYIGNNKVNYYCYCEKGRKLNANDKV